jgi:hypothetical protein
MLQGLGEPINELRQFLKDLSFRNSHEREQGELELLRQRLEIARDFGLLETEDARDAAWATLNSAHTRPSHRKRQRRELPRGAD